MIRLAFVVVVFAGCDRSRPSEPPAPPSTSASARVPAASPDEPPASATEPAPDAREPAEPAVACEPAADLEPVETWSASGPPPERPAEAVCAALEQRASRAIEDLRGPCETADDCELVRVACPFGCVRVFSKHADRRRARVAFDRYVDECPICKDKCPVLPEALACEDGVCVASNEPPDAACEDDVSGP